MLTVPQINSRLPFFTSPFYCVFNVIIIGLSNGVLGTYSMILGTLPSEKSEGEFSLKVAGYIMASHLVAGLALGSFIAFWVNKELIQ